MDRSPTVRPRATRATLPPRTNDDFPLPEAPTTATNRKRSARATSSATSTSRPKNSARSSGSNTTRPLYGGHAVSSSSVWSSPSPAARAMCPFVTGRSSDGSCAAIECSNARSSGPGSMPSSFAEQGAGALVRTQRVGLTSAPVRARASASPTGVRGAARRPPSSRARPPPSRRVPHAISTSTSSSAATRRISASRVASASATGQPSSSSSGTPRQSPRASRIRAAA